MELEEEQQQKRYQILLSCTRGKIRKTTTVLPEEIIHYEILPRLPAKFIVGFRLVCKSWKSLFSSSEFVKSHLTRQHSNKDQDLLIGHKYVSRHGVIIISHSTEIHVTGGPLHSDVLIGSINGLVCMATGKNFCIWNPAIGKIKQICLPSDHRLSRRHLVGFSWDHVGNDYKVVIVCYSSTSRQLSVYSSNSASWTELLIPDSVVPDGSVFDRPYSKVTPCTIVKGIPYWSSVYESVYLGQRRIQLCISVFKFVAENNEFRLLPNLTNISSPGIVGKEFNLVNLKDSLVGMAYKRLRRDSMVDIYSLDEESHNGVWSKMYTIGPIDLQGENWLLLQCFRQGGEILKSRFGTLYFYDPKTKKTEEVRTTPRCFKRCYNWCYSYTPSLVCVRGMNSDAGFLCQKKEVEELVLKYSDCLGIKRRAA